MNEAKKYCLEEVDPVPALVIVKLNNEVTWCTRAGERYRHYCYICNISIQYSVPSCPFPPRSYGATQRMERRADSAAV